MNSWIEVSYLDAARSEKQSCDPRSEGAMQGKPEMTTEGGSLQMMGLSSKPAWAQTWHLWTVIMPRRSITGRLVFGKVWRRHDGRRWIYKAFIELP